MLKEWRRAIPFGIWSGGMVNGDIQDHLFKFCHFDTPAPFTFFFAFSIPPSITFSHV